jgi:hypothetical protein
MKKKILIVTVIALLAAGAAFAAEKQAAPMPGPMMGTTDPKAMAEMMQSPAMQQQCVELMKSADMQQAMMGMMKLPEMQAAMKQMLQKDAGFHQVMLDLVNAVDINADHSHGPAAAPAPSGHGSHHQ